MSVYHPSTAEHKKIVTEVLGGKWFEDDEYDLNIMGVRNDVEEKAEYVGSNEETLVLHENLFNDLLVFSYFASGKWFTECFQATTDPGYYWRQNPGRGTTDQGIVRGVGAIREGFYPQVYRKGMHGSRPALVQDQSAFMVYRDNDLDKVLRLDPSNTEKGWGFNLHYMGGDSDHEVNRWSGGCQGPMRKKDYLRIMELVDLQIKHGLGDRFSYALVRSSWFEDIEIAKEDWRLIQGLPLE